MLQCVSTVIEDIMRLACSAVDYQGQLDQLYRLGYICILKPCSRIVQNGRVHGIHGAFVYHLETSNIPCYLEQMKTKTGILEADGFDLQPVMCATTIAKITWPISYHKCATMGDSGVAGSSRTPYKHAATHRYSGT